MDNKKPHRLNKIIKCRKSMGYTSQTVSINGTVCSGIFNNPHSHGNND